MDTLTEIAVPDIGDFADVPVIEILVAVGDAVAVEDPLVAIESDKATMEIPAPLAGVVREILVSVGDKVSEGTPILRIDVDGAAVDDARGSETERAVEVRPGADTARGEDLAGDGALVADAPTDGADAATIPGGEDEAPAEPARDWGDVYAGPAVRRVARERGIDLRTVTGSGRRGRITLEDLDRPLVAATGAANGAGGTPGAGADSLGLAPWPSVDFAKYGEIERVPLTRIQQLTGANLARNWVRIPHVTHDEDADITDLEAFRKRLNAEQSEVKVTMVALLLKAAAAALQAYPQFNASLDGEELVLKRYYHLGFAADTPQGLVVPVIRDVERKGLLELAGELTELSAKARARRLSAEEMSGATFTISSLGGIGGTSFTPIVNAPEVAILGVVRAAMRPVWDGQQFQPRLMLPLSLSYDHRVIDGAAAARFCAHLAGLLADMRRVLL
jgi:pyruvate dehydrogenase E2 component (dihydrolipoamide acetyltransferase)